MTNFLQNWPAVAHCTVNTNPGGCIIGALFGGIHLNIPSGRSLYHHQQSRVVLPEDK